MKIEIEELDDGVIGINDGERSVSVVESVSALDFHLARSALRNITEMLSRHLIKKAEETK